MDHPLRPIVGGWMSKIRLAQDVKREKFQRDADECMRFFDGPYDHLYGLKYREGSAAFTYAGDTGMGTPSFCMTVNKVAECVQIFGPVLYHRNPVRQVNPRDLPMLPPEVFGDPNDPAVQQALMPMLTGIQQQKSVDTARAKILEHYLNYTPTALDLKTESRRCIDEAIIKGMGVLWTELYTPRGSNFQMVGSFYDTVDNLFIDPDAESVREAKWIARRRMQPVWEVEKMFKLPKDTLKGGLESYGQQAWTAADRDGDYNRAKGQTNDLIVWYEVYSKMGLGGRLSGVPPQMREILDKYGEFTYLAIVENVPYPLNVPPPLIEMGGDEQIQQAVQWHTPFWADDEWPFTYLAFHEKPRNVWPISHMKPAMGELKFLNWAYSFLAGKVKNTCRDFVAVRKSAGEEMKSKILEGKDLTLLEVEYSHGTISEIVSFLQHPEMNGDILKVIQLVENNFEKRVGLTELMYGESSRQMRSASEAQVKSDQLQVRPDDMANKVEDMMGHVARKEALAARVHLTPERDIVPIMGPIGAQFWQQYVTPTSFDQLIHQMEYRIEAGSARKPNKDRDAANANEAMKNLFPTMVQVAMQTGQVQQVNALLGRWAKAMDMDAQELLFQPPPPPDPMMMQQQEGAPV